MNLFIDTNIILHFTPLDQIDWAEICGQQKVNVYFAPIIIEELDKQKRNSNQKISKRAKNAIKKIGEVGLQGSWTNNVVINVLTQRPTNNTYHDNGLNKDENDDRLLATIIEFKKLIDRDVKLITNDLGPKLKCLSLGIETISLLDKYELKDDDDDLVKENNRLKDEIRRYKSSIPKLKLLFENNKPHTTVELSRFDFSEFIKEKLVEIEEKYPSMELPSKEELGWVFRNPFINEESVKKYNSQLGQFFLNYADYLSDCKDYYMQLSLTKSLKIKLLNEGSIPANDIDIKLHFPDGFSLDSRMPTNIAEKPTPPTKPGTPFTLNPYFASSLIRPNLNPAGLVSRGSPSIKKTNSYDVNFDLDSLKHNQDYVFDELFLTFDSFEKAKGFTVDYKIFAGNVPDVLIGQLNVAVTVL